MTKAGVLSFVLSWDIAKDAESEVVERFMCSDWQG
jgi:hypothetical protein